MIKSAQPRGREQKDDKHRAAGLIFSFDKFSEVQTVVLRVHCRALQPDIHSLTQAAHYCMQCASITQSLMRGDGTNNTRRTRADYVPLSTFKCVKI